MEINTTGTNDETEKESIFNEYLDVFTRCCFVLGDIFVFNFSSFHAFSVRHQLLDIDLFLFSDKVL